MLAAPVPPGDTFGLDLQGTGGIPPDFGFCGPAPACQEGHSYVSRHDLNGGLTIIYKFERATAAGVIYVFNEGSYRVAGDQTISAVYSGQVGRG